VVGGPLLGGLCLYYLKKIRGEQSNIETAFSGFRVAFVQLFLANLAIWVLMIIGFLCLILPGLYLAVSWMFALILVIDKRLDFWPAMELSRKIITKHWWKFFGFWLVLLLMNVVGSSPAASEYSSWRRSAWPRHSTPTKTSSAWRGEARPSLAPASDPRHRRDAGRDHYAVGAVRGSQS